MRLNARCIVKLFIITMFYHQDNVLFLKLLGGTKTEIKTFILVFEKIMQEYKDLVNPAVAAIVVRSDLTARKTILKNYI